MAIISYDRQQRRQYIAQKISELKISKFDLFDYQEKITVAQVRELIAIASRRPISSPFQLHLLDAENLTFEAQQALLKILEEPPSYVLIYISTPNLEILLPTIISRLKLINLETIPKISNEIRKEYATFWKDILSQNPWQRLLMTDDFAKDRLTTLEWLDRQLLYLQNIMETDLMRDTSELNLNLHQVAYSLRQLLLTKKYLENNVATKLALDQMFLNLPVVNETKNAEKSFATKRHI